MDIRYLRDITLCFYRDGKIMKEPEGFVAKRDLCPKTNKFLHDFVTFLLNSDFISAEAKVYLINKNFSYYDVINDPRFYKVKESTIRYRINNSINKVNEFFGKNMLSSLIEHRNDAQPYINALNELKIKYSPQAFFKRNYIISFPDVSDIAPHDIDIEKVQNFLNEINCYKKDVVKNTNIDTETLSYIYKLLDNKELSEKEIRDRVELKKMLKF